MVAALLVLTGCVSGGNDTPSEPGPSGELYSGEVEWWTINLQKDFGDYIQGMIDEYEAEHPDVTIRWVDVPGQDVTTKLLASIASGQVPDAVNFSSQTIGLFGDSMSDLNEYFTPEELGTYSELLREPLTDVDGKQIAIPWYNGGANLGFYRSSVVEQAGFDPENPPMTWEEALALAQRVRDETGVYGANMMAYSTTVQSYGVSMLSEDRSSAAFNTPETVEIFETFKRHYDSGAIAPGVLGKDQRKYEQNLENAQIAFSPSMVSSQLSNVQSNAPDVYEDIVVGPAVTGTSEEQLLIAQQIFGIPEASDQKAAAAEWLKYVTSAERQLEFTKLVPIYPSTPETLEDPYFSEITGSTPADQARRILVETFDDIRDASLGSGNDERLREIFDEEVRAYMSGNKSAEEALTAAETAWNAVLESA